MFYPTIDEEFCNYRTMTDADKHIRFRTAIFYIYMLRDEQIASESKPTDYWSLQNPDYVEERRQRKREYFSHKTLNFGDLPITDLAGCFTEEYILSIKGIGKKTLDAMKVRLAKYGLSFNEQMPKDF